ncbi:hypothetical protein GCM10010441_62370 [Kitasatospora paracochleata]|uniref:DNA-binding GntR family transcriptional regulator n=1 Tax=Kitasatospora paracochleata TaxID=58354 RepID=A0ABT1J067_9ACTN|nr:UTRA domain-containing protein [Kitasatospora paracochleata]MCP2310558.1 DNA-binding GntR family transcriptional regulator [Kitasatospora paracochleata]
MHFREVTRARTAFPDEVEALGLSKGAVAMLIVRHAYAVGGVLVVVNEMTLDASRYLREWDFPAATDGA